MQTPSMEVETRLGKALDEAEELYGVVLEVELETPEEWNRMACRVADLAADLKTVVLCCGYAARQAVATA